MSEVNSRKCKKCGDMKQRIYDGKYPNNKDKKWRDESGLLWMGNVCGKCNRFRSKAAMRQARIYE